MNSELKRILNKAERTCRKAVEAMFKAGHQEKQELDMLIICINNTIKTGKALAKKLDDLLTADSIAMYVSPKCRADRFRLSNPFDQTKTQVKTTIDLLEK